MEPHNDMDLQTDTHTKKAPQKRTTQPHDEEADESNWRKKLPRTLYEDVRRRYSQRMMHLFLQCLGRRTSRES
jgi:hypothetical protein